MKKVIVVIPIYNKILKPHEEISLTQCFKILKNHSITFICSPELDVQPYLNLAKNAGIKVNFETFKADYFRDISGYNKLMLSQEFYKKFVAYKYMLLYQTDAYVFRDELDDWCDLNYDYIGSPWLQDMEGWLYIPGAFPKEFVWFYQIFGVNKMKRTGNGGLSLRKIKSHISNLSLFNFWVKRWKSNEDNFFCQCVSVLNPFFKIPPYKKSLQFGFDGLPIKAYQLNNNNLPFGCHAFQRSDGFYEENRAFWCTFIPALK